MSKVPADLKYSESHEWVRTEDDGTLSVGISDHAQDSLGELVYVELPETGRKVAQGEAVAVVESVKAASDVYSPVDGEIVAVNEALADAPDTINSDPYEKGWILRVQPDEGKTPERLMDAEAYESSLEE